MLDGLPVRWWIAGQLFVVTGDLQDAEDVTQEAFARASIRWSGLRT